MLLHGNVSNKFGLGVIIPILKEKRGDLTSLDNYRPITLSPVISKIFESVLPIKYGDYLYSDDRRFGFKCRIARTNPFGKLHSHTSPLLSRHNLLLGNHDTIVGSQPILACYTFCIGFRMFVQYGRELEMTNCVGERWE